ncbi:MAG TPA: peptidase T [Vicinamibacterales bacterium]|jgi:tripeptide aminopeptidase|nr:peptidase T [Vicinamibacterales bacterium]
MNVLDRFLRYVTIDTRADDTVATCPTTQGQLEMMRLLETELRGLGLTDVSVDANAYLMATIPSTVSQAVPTIGFIAHVDTSPEMPGNNVRPIVHRSWDGSDIVLPDDPTAVLTAADNPDLAAQIGNDIVTASGKTLLGADDKAGVAAIMAAAEYLMTHPGVLHGTIRIGFTPDEEIGRGANHFDVGRFGAVCAYTLDGGAAGELEYESFSADVMRVTFKGFNTHPGFAARKMVNSIKAAARFIDSLPADALSPETTSGYEGFVHPYQLDAGVDRTSVRVLLRDFVTSALDEKAELVERAARLAAKATGAMLEIERQEQYRNMREILDRHPEVVQRARDAFNRIGLTPIERPIRGGTDGSRLSFMGLPTPNLFAGEHNFHSRLEWTSRQELELAARAIVAIAEEWAKRD